jgi:hypothetical protein
VRLASFWPAALAAVAAPEVIRFLGGWAMILTALAWHRPGGLAAAQCAPASRSPALRTAIGIKHPHIAQKAQGAMGGSFNTREFFHGRSAAFLKRVKWVFLLLVFALPLGLLAGGFASAAFFIQYLGLIAERWFFFAQANHPQNLYYQAVHELPKKEIRCPTLPPAGCAESGAKVY